MSKEIGFRLFILAVSLIILIKGIMKLPKKVAIGFIIWLVLSSALIVIACVYYPETVMKIVEFFGVDLNIEL